MEGSSSFVPLPYTIPVDSIRDATQRRRRNDLEDERVPASEKKRTIRHYGFRRETEDELELAMELRPRVTQHRARERSVILLTMCDVCREHMLEGSYASGRCTRCGSPHPLPAGLPS